VHGSVGPGHEIGQSGLAIGVVLPLVANIEEGAAQRAAELHVEPGRLERAEVVVEAGQVERRALIGRKRRIGRRAGEAPFTENFAVARLPGTANSPKSGYRMTAEGKPIERRRNFTMMAMDLKAIWEMSVRKRFRARVQARALLPPAPATTCRWLRRGLG